MNILDLLWMYNTLIHFTLNGSIVHGMLLNRFETVSFSLTWQLQQSVYPDSLCIVSDKAPYLMVQHCQNNVG